ncbi:hypothetical protein D3C72_1831080 [compost metagenome]
MGGGVRGGAGVSAGAAAGLARNANERAMGTGGSRRPVSRLVSAGPTKITPSSRVWRRSTWMARSCVAASK